MTSLDTVAFRRWDRSRISGFLIVRGPLLVFVVLLVYMALSSPFFLEGRNIASILRQSAPDAILAMGLAAVVMAGGDDIVVGGIDISIPAASVLGVAIMADLLTAGDAPLGVAFLLAALAVLAVGVVNALLVEGIGLTPLLATLATSVAVVGITRWVTNNRRITVENAVISQIRDGSVLGVPIPALIMVVTFGIVGFWLHRTRFGLRLQAVGGSRSAAEMSGLSTRKYIASSFIIASGAAVVASVVLIARGSGMSPGIEQQLLLDMVLATFVGAAFSSRRVVTIPGALLGAVLVKALSIGFQLLNVDIFKVGMVKGVLILFVVATAAVDSRESQ
ncbi:MAG: ABC transporter permease [Actinobacteria bacterium]|nr:ABC transporter permease [Actinomycetota bacterium]